MSKLTGNQEFNGEVYIKGIGGYDGTNIASATSVTEIVGDVQKVTEEICWEHGDGDGSIQPKAGVAKIWVYRNGAPDFPLYFRGGEAANATTYRIMSFAGAPPTTQFPIGTTISLDKITTALITGYERLDNSDCYMTVSQTLNPNATIGDCYGYVLQEKTFDANCVASGDYSYSEGSGTTASGRHSHAEGFGTSAQGLSSHVEGGKTNADGYYTHAEGYSTFAGGYFSHAEGVSTIANGGSAAHAEGEATSALTSYAHAEGNSTIANGEAAHAEGNGTSAITFYCHAEGDRTIAKSPSSHAEGQHTVAWGERASHAEGLGTKALGGGAHAEGRYTLANGPSSHSEGEGTSALTEYSHAEGFRTIANNFSEHAEGQYNVSNTSSGNYGNSGNTQHSVGIGTSNSNRKNAFEIMQNGDAYLYGVGGYDGTNPTSASTIQEVIGDIETLLSQI